MSKVYPIAVIGGGSAGVMAVLRAVLNNDETIFFPGTFKDRRKSRERWVKKVENMPAHLNFKRGIEEPNKETLSWLENCALKGNFHWKKERGIKKITKDSGFFLLEDDEGNKHQAEHVILCTGVMDVQPEIQGSIRDILPFANKQTVDYCLRCDGHHVFDREVIVIGHTSDAVWTAVILQERYQTPNMSIVTNGKAPEFDEKTKKLIDLYKFDVYEEPIQQILGDPKTGEFNGLILCCGSTVQAQICFISLGMIVYNELALELGAKVDERGFVITDEKGESSIDGLYVAGDLRAGLKKQIYTAWDSAVDSADAINSKLRKRKRDRLLSNL